MPGGNGRINYDAFVNGLSLFRFDNVHTVDYMDQSDPCTCTFNGGASLPMK